MLFAAGKGTRMGALTADRPKPLIKVAGKKLIDHALAQIKDARIPNVVTNVHYFSWMISDHLKGTNFQISDETDALLETGGGLRHALPLLGPEPVFTMNSDAVWTGPNPLNQLAEVWDPERMDALVLLVEPSMKNGYKGKGDFVRDADGRLRRGPDLIYTGAQILATDLLEEIPENIFSLNRVWDLMLERGRLFGIVHSGGWCDVGSPEGIDAATKMLEAEGYV